MTKTMKKLFAITVFWFVFLIFFVYIQTILIPKNNSRDSSFLFNSRLTPYTNGTRSRAFELLPKNSVDVAFIGSSTVFCGVNPVQLYSEYGIAGHDYAVGAMTGYLTDYITELIFENQRPKLILLDATRLYSDFPNASISHLTPFTRLSEAKWNLAMRTTDLTSIVEDLVPFLQCHQRWTEVCADDFSFAFSSREDLLLGMVGMTQPADDAAELAERFSKPHSEYLSYEPPVKPYLTDLGKQQILECAAKCRQYGAECVLFVCPTVFGNEAAKYMAQVEEFALQNEISFMNFCKNRCGMVLEPQDFADDHHLTVSGMQKFTAVLGEYLNQNYQLPDRRNQKGYERYARSEAAYAAAMMQMEAEMEEQEDAV